MNEIDLVGLASLESFLMLKKKKKSLPTCYNVKVVAIILNHVALCVCVCSRPKCGMLSRAKKGCELPVLRLVALLPLPTSTCHLNLLIEPEKLMPEDNWKGYKKRQDENQAESTSSPTLNPKHTCKLYCLIFLLTTSGWMIELCPDKQVRMALIWNDSGLANEKTTFKSCWLHQCCQR